MSTILKFIRATLTGGILFLLPIVLLIILFNKAREIFHVLSAPLADRLPDRILGFDGSALLTIVLMIAICFISGLLFRAERVRQGMTKLEQNVLSFLPGYLLLKSITADALGEHIDNVLSAVLVADGDTREIGFLIEENETLCTVFIPDAPRYDAGAIKIVPASTVQKISMPTNKVTLCIKSLGKGALQWSGQS